MQNHLLAKVPEFIIEDVKYTYRRLHHTDVIRVINICKEAIKMGGADISLNLNDLVKSYLNGDENIADGAITFILILFGMEFIEKDLSLFISGLLRTVDEEGKKQKVELEDVMNPEKFPIYGLIQSLLYLAAHPDLSMMMEALEGGKSLPFSGSQAKTLLKKINSPA